MDITRYALKDFDIGSQYRTGEDDLVGFFYKPCLSSAIDYLRAAGYFRSTVFLVIAEDLVRFAQRGGRMRLVCSPEMSSQDISGIQLGYEQRNSGIQESLLQQIDKLAEEKDSAYRIRIMATLIATGALEVKFAVRPNARGIFHEKIGVFKDEDGNSVSFIGSINETWSGWHYLGNHEAIEVFRSWASQGEASRIMRHEAYFDRLWKGEIGGLETIDFPEAARRKLLVHALDSLDEIDCEELKTGIGMTKPPMPHQSSAIRSWKAAGCKGILEHATGSGKTITALIAIKEHVEAGMPAIVIVPSRLLLEQWRREVQEAIPDAAILLAGGGNSKWKNNSRLQALLQEKHASDKRVVIATMQTASSQEFLMQVGKHRAVLLVADEVHQSGSPQNSKVYKLMAEKRLGLSATPKRYGDPDGTARMLEFFGGVLEPKFSLQDAIKSGRLVEYEYFPHLLSLSEEEAAEWKRLTLQIIREINSDESNTKSLSEKARLLLIRRARVAKKAASKIGLAGEVLKRNFRKGQRWLIYCEDQQQLEEVMREIESVGLSPSKYHSALSDDVRQATLQWFKDFGGILVSIKCLDEGVDIPLVDHALILASSQNPRQFIQRRGRVLRVAKGKFSAVIHDAIVVPIDVVGEPDQISLLKSEMKRAIEFASSALNRGAEADLRKASHKIGFDPDSLFDCGEEEVEVDE